MYILIHSIIHILSGPSLSTTRTSESTGTLHAQRKGTFLNNEEQAVEWEPARPEGNHATVGCNLHQTDERTLLLQVQLQVHKSPTVGEGGGSY